MFVCSFQTKNIITDILNTFRKCVALEIDLISPAQCQKMGSILSNFSKLDSIINPEAPKEVKAETESKNESVIEGTDSTAKTPVESDMGAPKEVEAEAKSEINTIVSEKAEPKEEDTKEKLSEELPKEGKKVEVEPVDVSKVADVIKKPTRKRKRHQKA